MDVKTKFNRLAKCKAGYELLAEFEFEEKTRKVYEHLANDCYEQMKRIAENAEEGVLL